MHIRHATIDDLDKISAVEAVAFPPAEAAARESIRQRLGVYPECFWLLESGEGELCAYVNGLCTDIPDLADEMFDAVSMHNPSGAWQMIFSVVTAPQHRKKGYAAQTLSRALADAEARGQKGAVLTCKEALIPFYARLGFKDEGISGSTHGGAVWHQMRCTF